jgi:hypothetical protein
MFYDRNENTVDGFLTLIKIDDDGTVTNVFKKLAARSGQAGHTKTSWTRGKSPIPYGTHKMTTKPTPLWMEPVGTPFFAIGSLIEKIRVIFSGESERWDIGLHLENRFKGSAGCVVVVDRTQGMILFDYIKKLDERYIDFIVL